jgi:hypothetical protein
VNEVSDAAERHAEREVRAALKGLMRTLEEVRAQRSAPHRPGTHARHLERQRGEINGLDIAIAAIKRRIG